MFSIRSVRVLHPHSNKHWNRKMLKFLRNCRISIIVCQERKPWHLMFSKLKSESIQLNGNINERIVFLDHQKALNSSHWIVLRLKKHLRFGRFVIIVRCDCLNVLRKLIWALERLKRMELWWHGFWGGRNWYANKIEYFYQSIDLNHIIPRHQMAIWITFGIADR